MKVQDILDSAGIDMYTNLRGFAHNPPKKSKPLSTAILLVTRLSSFINNISCHFKCSVSDPKYNIRKILLYSFNVAAAVALRIQYLRRLFYTSVETDTS